jgi:hypothetical protein
MSQTTVVHEGPASPWSPGIGYAQEAAASPAISRRSSCPWSLCYTRCYTQAAISTSQPPGMPIQHSRERRGAKAGAWQANDRGRLSSCR